MRKLIAAINMTVDGFCDHTAGIADDDIHEHYADLLRGAGLIIYGRKTYQLMEYWRSVVENPTGNRSIDDFAVTMDGIAKIVYSRTLESVDWKGTELRREIDRDDILRLKEQQAKNLLVGSPSMIVELGNLGLIDEYQLGIHPVVIGHGLPLFRNVSERIDLDLIGTKKFDCGVVIHYYVPK